jgi:hypothetical protein
LEGLETEDVGIFYGHLVYFASIRYTLWPFGIFDGHLVYFFSFWYVVCTKENLAILLFNNRVRYLEESGKDAEVDVEVGLVGQLRERVARPQDGRVRRAVRKTLGKKSG